MTPQLKRVRNNQHHTISGRNKITTKRRSARSLYFLRYFLFCSNSARFFCVCLFVFHFFFSFENVPLFRACLRYNELDLALFISTFSLHIWRDENWGAYDRWRVLYFQSGANGTLLKWRMLWLIVSNPRVFFGLFFWYGELVSCLVGLRNTGRVTPRDEARILSFSHRENQVLEIDERHSPGADSGRR